jgi:VanZ family protein
MTQPRTVTLDRSIDGGLVALAFLAFVATAYASLRSSGPDLLDLPDQDKIGHAVAYFAVLLPLLFALVWRPGRGDGILPHGQLWLVAGLVVVGIGMEVLQALLTTTRVPEALDVVADAVGAGAALLVFGLIRRTSATG